MHIIAISFQTFGTVLIGVTALRVHHRVLSHKKIDSHVQNDFKREQRLGALGIALIVVGYFTEVLPYLIH